MSDLRHRKLPKNERSRSKSRSRSSNGSNGFSLRFIFCCVVIFTTFLIGFYLDVIPWNKYYTHSTSVMDNISLALGLKQHVHAVIIDAGSTGSRVIAYTFVQSDKDNTLKLENELFVELKPGLSSFADTPKESTKNLAELLNRAKSVIPSDKWSATPLTMKATAGLRLLPAHKAEALLDEARKLFDESGFLVNDKTVSIMDGSDEGVFSWFTVNFLLDKFGDDVSKTVAALDLGGGSTQVTFAMSEDDSVETKNEQYLHRINAFHDTLDVYTRSFLGLGLMAARKGILQFGNPENAVILKSECINTIITTSWKYGGVDYTIKGPDKGATLTEKIDDETFKVPVVNYNKCEKLVKKYVGDIDKPSQLAHREITAFSYYYDRAVETGLLGLDKKGGTVTVEKFVSTSKEVCNVANVDQPFTCLDMIFISVLLRDGFGLDPKTNIKLVKHIDGHEVSWALGAAFHLMQNGV